MKNKVKLLIDLLIKHKRIIFIVILAVILIRPILTVIDLRESLFYSGYEEKYSEFKELYSNSQFVKKEDPVIIRDEVFRSFAGGVFLKGLNPILITHDHPPLGNYFISLSILIFDNSKTIIVFSLITIGIAIFLISRLVMGSSIFALIPLGFLINEPLFLNKLRFAPLVEPIQLPFILFAFYFFIKALYDKKYIKWFILTSIMLGFVISIRFFVTGAVMTFCMGLYLLYEERSISKKLLSFIFSLPLALVVLVMSYARTIMDGYSIVQVFGIQRYILEYHSSKFTLPFSFWQLILFNRWYTWWGDRAISSDPNWLILWPLSVLSTIAHGIMYLFKKIKLNKAEKFLFIWLVIYTLTLSTGYSSTNYFLSVLPFFYILSVAFFKKILIGVYEKI